MSEHHKDQWTSKDRSIWKPRIAATLPRPCTICGHVVDRTMSWQIDHIRPLSQGGRSTADNLGPAHSNRSGPGGRSCNQAAGGRLSQQQTKQRKRAQDQEEQRHIKW